MNDEPRGMVFNSLLRRRAVPLFFMLLGLWLLAGCFYLPLPEHRTGDEKVDFRDLVKDTGPKRRLRPGAVTRAQVLAALGPPLARSADGRAIGYTLETERAVWLWPLCFRASPAKVTSYGLRLVFNEAGLLTDWKMIHQDREVALLNGVPPSPQEVIRQLNDQHDGPQLVDGSGPKATSTSRPAP